MVLLFKHKLLKALRSVSLGRKLLTGIIVAFLGFIVLGSVLSIGFVLELIVQQEIGSDNVNEYLNTYLIFFFLVEMLYRIFLQKNSAIELENFLHLPIGRSKIIHFLLITSFVSALNIIALLLFGPYALTEISSTYSSGSALSWLGTVIGISWSIHWFMLWFKQKYGNDIVVSVSFFVFILLTFAAANYGYFNVGEFLQPFLAASLHSILPLVTTIILGACTYYLAFRYYRKHAYVEELQQAETRSANTHPSLFGNFGLAGELADLELKLILRHKKSKTYLIISLLFVAYGLWVYTDSEMIGEDVISFITIFVGIFITGAFLINYGQFFLSWNSPYFDFLLLRDHGVESLVKGKYLIFLSVSLVCFLLSLPYVYFAWEALFINLACFLFNMGVNVHVTMAMGLWKPKPIDLNDGNLFSMEGTGAAQFLMGIPIILLPYLTYLPFSLLASKELGLIAVGAAGIIGLLCHKQLTRWHSSRLQTKRYQIADSFRQEL